MFGIIVVGTDGSLTADRAVARAAELASRTGDVLHIVTAYRLSPAAKSEAETAPDPQDAGWAVGADDEARATLRSAAVLALQVGVEAATHAREGDPAKVILSTAEDLGAELIVVGSKGVERRILGSVPTRVTHDARCDVLVVHTV